MNTRSHDESRQHYIDLMGTELGSYFFALYEETVWLETTWSEYRELYGTNPDRIDILNQAAPAFFFLLDEMIWENVILRTARLTDKPERGDRERLTIEKLPHLVKAEGRLDVRKAVSIARKKVEFCRDWRNRRLAHRSLPLAIRAGARPLAPRSRASMNEAIAAIANVLNVVIKQYDNVTILFKMHLTGGAYSLLTMISDGIESRKERDEKISRGELPSSARIPRKF